MQINKIQSNNYKNQTNFTGSHHPRHFSTMMNYIFKKTIGQNPDMFEATNTILVSTKLDNGKEITGAANFFNGKFVGLVLEDGCEHLKSKFMKTVLNKYIEKISSKNIKDKIARNGKSHF